MWKAAWVIFTFLVLDYLQLPLPRVQSSVARSSTALSLSLYRVPSPSGYSLGLKNAEGKNGLPSLPTALKARTCVSPRVIPLP